MKDNTTVELFFLNAKSLVFNVSVCEQNVFYIIYMSKENQLTAGYVKLLHLKQNILKMIIIFNILYKGIQNWHFNKLHTIADCIMGRCITALGNLILSKY